METIRKTLITDQATHTALTAIKGRLRHTTMTQTLNYLLQLDNQVTPDTAQINRISDLAIEISNIVKQSNNQETQADILRRLLKEQKDLTIVEDHFPALFEMSSMIHNDIITKKDQLYILRGGYIQDTTIRLNDQQLIAYDSSQPTDQIIVKGYSLLAKEYLSYL